VGDDIILPRDLERSGRKRQALPNFRKVAAISALTTVGIAWSFTAAFEVGRLVDLMHHYLEVGVMRGYPELVQTIVGRVVESSCGFTDAIVENQPICAVLLPFLEAPR
jgi:hypothetical protein